jgi:hypothetical protein
MRLWSRPTVALLAERRVAAATNLATSAAANGVPATNRISGP